MQTNNKLREALEKIARITNTAKSDFDVFVGFERILKISNSALDALAEPPRNCDRFANETAAQIAFLNEVCLIHVTSLDDDPFDCWTNLMKYRYVKWLFAEVKGGAK